MPGYAHEPKEAAAPSEKNRTRVCMDAATQTSMCTDAATQTEETAQPMEMASGGRSEAAARAGAAATMCRPVTAVAAPEKAR